MLSLPWIFGGSSCSFLMEGYLVKIDLSEVSDKIRVGVRVKVSVGTGIRLMLRQIRKFLGRAPWG